MKELKYKSIFWQVILLTNLVLLLNFLLHTTFEFFKFSHYEFLEAVIVSVLLVGIVHSVLYFVGKVKN